MLLAEGHVGGARGRNAGGTGSGSKCEDSPRDPEREGRTHRRGLVKESSNWKHVT